MLKKNNLKYILLLWFIISLLYFLNQFSILDYLQKKLNEQNLSLSNIEITIFILVIIVFTLIIFFISLFVLSLIMYFIGVISNNVISKMNCLYIISLTVMINMLSTIPLSIMNFINNENITLLSNNLLFVLFNPFLLLSLFVLYKELKKQNISTSLIIIYILVFYSLQTTSQFIISNSAL
ncbi:hypothetical protein CYK06_10795 [Staphylococcus hominis]|nr:hypothetical protein CYK06_10795 [Staphylococcus hominis]